MVLWILLILPMLLDGFFLDKIDLISLGRIGPISNCLSPIGKLGNQLTASRAKGTGVEYLFLNHSLAKLPSKLGLSSSLPIKPDTAF